MTTSKEVQKWIDGLQDLDPKVQMGVLTEIGRSFFRTEEAREEREVSGAVQVGGPALAERELPASLRDAILEKLNAEDPQLRAEALLALVHWRDEETRNALLESLKDPDSTVRLAAVQAMAKIGEHRFLSSLLEVSENDADELVQAHALAAIEELLQSEVEGSEREPLAAARRTRGAVRVLMV